MVRCDLFLCSSFRARDVLCWFPVSAAKSILVTDCRFRAAVCRSDYVSKHAILTRCTLDTITSCDTCKPPHFTISIYKPYLVWYTYYLIFYFYEEHNKYINVNNYFYVTVIFLLQNELNSNPTRKCARSNNPLTRRILGRVSSVW